MKKKASEKLLNRSFRASNVEYKEIKKNWKEKGKDVTLGRFIVRKALS